MNESIFMLVIAIFLLLLAFCFLVLAFQYKRDYSDFKAIVVNLPKRRERILQFGKNYCLPVSYEIADAVDGSSLDLDDLVKHGIIGRTGHQSILNIQNGVPKTFHYEVGSKGAVGCSLSHISIWEKIVNENIKYMMVFEDDAFVVGISMDDIINRINDLPDNWHMYLIGQPHTVLEGIPILGKRDLYKVTRFCGTHAYIINNAGARWLLTHGQLYPIQQQIDSHLAELGYEHGFNTYIHLNVPLINPMGSSSDIQVNSKSARWDRFQIK